MYVFNVCNVQHRSLEHINIYFMYFFYHNGEVRSPDRTSRFPVFMEEPHRRPPTSWPGRVPGGLLYCWGRYMLFLLRSHSLWMIHSTQEKWAREQMKPRRNHDSLWKQMGLILAQLDGLHAGAAEWLKIRNREVGRGLNMERLYVSSFFDTFILFFPATIPVLVTFWT